MQENNQNEIKHGLVSVIVPVYNVEQYLDRCVESIVNQTYHNLEIILIDDGSSDKSGLICDQWVRKDNRIRVVHKKNGGLGYARNSGIEAATGEYLYAVDSDDFIDLNTIEHCYNAAVEYNADLVVFGLCRIDENNVVTENEIWNNEVKVYCGEDTQHHFLSSMLAPYPKDQIPVKLYMSACTSFIRRQLIEKLNLRYASEKEIISEDIYFLLNLCLHVDTAVILPEINYYYFINHQSLTSSYRKDRFEKNQFFYDACYKLAKDADACQEVLQSISYPYVSNVIALLKMIANGSESGNEKKRMMKEILLNQHFRKAVSKMNLKKEKVARRILLIGIKRGWYRFCMLLVFMKG